jgi:hypothetical protein
VPAPFVGCVAITGSTTSWTKALFFERDAIGFCTHWMTVTNTKTGETLANTQAD